MPQIEFNIKISPSELEKYYAGVAKVVSVIANSGQRLQFPANLMLPYVTHSGINGHFLLDYANDGKAKRLIKLDEQQNSTSIDKQV